MRVALFVHTCVWHMCVAPLFTHVRAPLCSHMCVARRYSATNSLDLTSAPSTVTISVLKSNDVPSADPQPATISASAKSVDLTIATVDSDTQFVALFINSLPARGNLYASLSTAVSTKGGRAAVSTFFGKQII